MIFRIHRDNILYPPKEWFRKQLLKLYRQADATIKNKDMVYRLKSIKWAANGS